MLQIIMECCQTLKKTKICLVALAAIILITSCVKLRVYAPQSNVVGDLYKDIESRGKVIVKASYKKEASFASQQGSWFSDEIDNEGGVIERVIRDAIHKSPERFVKPGKTLILDIREFRLFSEESFWDSRAEVSLKVNIVRNDGPPREFTFQKVIESSVSDSTAFVSTITIAGWLIYGPYIGFRGTLADQLNYLGRFALAELFRNIEITANKMIPDEPDIDRADVEIHKGLDEFHEDKK